MLEKAGQPSKSSMAYKSRSLHVASFLISLVRWLYNRYFPYHQKICRQWWSLSLSDENWARNTANATKQTFSSLQNKLRRSK